MTDKAEVRNLMRLKSVAIIAASTVLIWQIIVLATGVPPFILPSPITVAATLIDKARYLLSHAAITALEVLSGLIIGCVLGIASAVFLVCVESSRRWALPMMVVSQSLPVFALAPLLTLWLGYGIAPKIFMAVLIIYFPVVAASFDGLRHTPEPMLQLARSMSASRWSQLRHIRFPAALPSIASGIRVAASVAPIGAVVGEWVGSSKGLGYVMLQANARLQTELMFAALICLCVFGVSLYSMVNATLDRCLHWQSDSAVSA